MSSTDGISSHAMFPSSLSYQKEQYLVVEGSNGYFGFASRRPLGWSTAACTADATRTSVETRIVWAGRTLQKKQKGDGPAHQRRRKPVYFHLNNASMLIENEKCNFTVRQACGMFKEQMPPWRTSFVSIMLLVEHFCKNISAWVKRKKNHAKLVFKVRHTLKGCYSKSIFMRLVRQSYSTGIMQLGTISI